jgi:hypothetical protein
VTQSTTSDTYSAVVSSPTDLTSAAFLSTSPNTEALTSGHAVPGASRLVAASSGPSSTGSAACTSRLVASALIPLVYVHLGLPEFSRISIVPTVLGTVLASAGNILAPHLRVIART